MLTAVAGLVLLAGVSTAATMEPQADAPVAAPSPPAPVVPARPVPLPVLAEAGAVGPVAPDPGEPGTWTPQQLGAQLLVACVPHTSGARAVALARQGVGGIVVMGRPTDPRALTALLDQVRLQAAQGVAPIVASDEEGGRVQRLRDVLGALPPAVEAGRWDDARLEATAARYGTGMRALGYQLALGPVADLATPGSWLTQDGRSYSSDPARVGSAVVSWSRGLASAGVLSAAKHWPGHGRAGDSHVLAPEVPPLAALEGSDLVPFDAVLEVGAPFVMVGHLKSEGLTEPGLPATLSPHAYQVLRGRAGPGTVLLTDSLSMAAASSAVGLTPAQAAVRALQAGADAAMVCTGATDALAAVQAAVADGSLPRPAVLASVRRLLAVKQPLGLLQVPLTTSAPAGAITSAALDGGQVVLHGRATDPDSEQLPVVRLLVDGVATTEVAQEAVGFTARLPVPTGSRVCALALNTGLGRPTPLGCVTGP